MLNRLERRRQKRLQRSAPATPDGPTIQLEHFYTIAPELPPLFEAHGKERNEEVDPDWKAFFDLGLQGVLRVLTIRDRGLLVGYVFNLVRGHLHIKRKLHCFIDGFYIQPAYRGGLLAMKLLRKNDEYLASWGVKRCYVGVDIGGKVGLIFERLGYQPCETFMRKDFP